MTAKTIFTYSRRICTTQGYTDRDSDMRNRQQVLVKTRECNMLEEFRPQELLLAWVGNPSPESPQNPTVAGAMCRHRSTETCRAQRRFYHTSGFPWLIILSTCVTLINLHKSNLFTGKVEEDFHSPVGRCSCSWHKTSGPADLLKDHEGEQEEEEEQ